MTAPPITAVQAPAAPTGGTDDKKSERRLAFVLITPAVLLMLAVTASISTTAGLINQKARRRSSFLSSVVGAVMGSVPCRRRPFAPVR